MKACSKNVLIISLLKLDMLVAFSLFFTEKWKNNLDISNFLEKKHDMKPKWCCTMLEYIDYALYLGKVYFPEFKI